jgi:SAM-dependent methyltransferase
MSGLRDCPVCGRPDPMPSVERAAIPVFQNVTYADAEAAAAAPTGRFVLATCRGCGFSYNGAFEPDRVVYDETYDNHVASDAFRDYYRSLAAMLIERFGITGGCVYDIGCGKGEFLEIFHGLAPQVRAIGIDPSCTPREDGNFRLIRAPFSAELLAGDAKLVLLRHVLEHLAEPVAFLKELRAAMPDVPLFIEVPDLDWILDEDAFWDFCYEHCNYFTLPSLARACREAGFTVEAQSRSFGAQYQWALCHPAPAPHGATGDAGDALARVGAYAVREGGRIEALTELARARGDVAIWGMATKGVLLSNILPRGLTAGGVDMNEGKQGRFVAGSAVEVHPPAWLRERPAGSTVLVMNPNYAAEIAATVRDIGASVSLTAV